MLFLYNPRSFTTSFRNLDLVVDPLGVLHCNVQHLCLAAVGLDLPGLDAPDVPEQ